jgi:hypothetical protein
MGLSGNRNGLPSHEEVVSIVGHSPLLSGACSLTISASCLCLCFHLLIFIEVLYSLVEQTIPSFGSNYGQTSEPTPRLIVQTGL